LAGRCGELLAFGLENISAQRKERNLARHLATSGS
jgi:hypothetical protein